MWDSTLVFGTVTSMMRKTVQALHAGTKNSRAVGVDARHEGGFTLGVQGARLLTAVLCAAGVVLATVPASALTNEPAEITLRRAVLASDPGTSLWALQLRPGWTDRAYRVDGRTTVTKVQHGTETTWNVEGDDSLVRLRADRVPASVLAALKAPSARWVSLDGERDQYLVAGTPVTTDAGIRPDRIAAWLIETGTVSGHGGEYHASRHPSSLPAAVDRFFFDDGESTVNVSVFVARGLVIGYRFEQHSKYDDVRRLDVRTIRPARSLTVPGGRLVVGQRALEEELERHGSPSRVLAALPARADGYDYETMAGYLADRPRNAVPELTVAPTITGAVLIPGLSSETAKLSAARCVDLPAAEPQSRPCTQADTALLPERMMFYAEWLRSIVRLGLSEDDRFWALDRLNHNLWLYSGLQFEHHEIAAWNWFYLETLTRALVSEQESYPAPAPGRPGAGGPVV